MELEKNKLDSNKARDLNDSRTVIERGRRIKIAAEIGLVASSKGRQWSRALHRRLLRKKGRDYSNKNGCNNYQMMNNVGKEDHEEGGDEVVEIERRVRVLQSLVPGGEAMEMESLFEETADYIEALEGQVSAMRALATFLDGLEKKWIM
ncbi:transcription factor bHLH148-like [Dioscorea cayenensis subsp. rotundata]|uniref:Transcription factor bHLH148-like n=1 Tax=Dioscorea cayennensis subsp. rotundata TaxID=55577 RepID=A0AB40AM56_DIOCR|nr:transcription factor bHLH148-like [Dioscorea cayenensis subsp. rotundata]